MQRTAKPLFGFYSPIFNPVTGKESRREFLNLFTFDKPETPEQETHFLIGLLKQV